MLVLFPTKIYPIIKERHFSDDITRDIVRRCGENMYKNNRLQEIITLIVIYGVGLTSTMTLALESRHSPKTQIAAATIEGTMEKIHSQDQKDKVQNKEEVHDDKCYAYRKQLQDIELQLKGSENANPRDVDPTQTSSRLSEGSIISDLHKQADVLREQIRQYCTY